MAIQTVVSYVSEQVTNPQTNAVTYSLLRLQCNGGQSVTPTTSQTLSKDLGTSTTVTINGSGTSANTFSTITSCFTSWANVQNPAGCAQADERHKGDPSVTEPETQTGSSNYSYTLVGVSTNSSASPAVTTTTVPSSYGCNFATAGSGAYATQLCFADFTGFNNTIYSATDKSCNGNRRPGATSRAHSGHVVHAELLCLRGEEPVQLGQHAVSGEHRVCDPHLLRAANLSEAFLGNNGFYTGIGGLPALYQYQPTTTPATMSTIYITDFQVLDAAGQSGKRLDAGNR